MKRHNNTPPHTHIYTQKLKIGEKRMCDCSKDNQTQEFKPTKKMSEGNRIIPSKYLWRITTNLEIQILLY